MKYLFFTALSMLLVPATALLCYQSKAWRGRILAALLFSVALGDVSNINFLSMESYRGPERGFEVSLTDLLVMGVIVGLVLGRPTLIRRLPVNTVWLLVFFAWTSVSFLISPAPIFGAFFLFKLVRLFAIYWCVAILVEDGVSWKYLQWGLTVLGIFCLLLTLKQKYVDGIYRVPLLFDHSNTVPLLLNLAFPALLLLALRPYGNRRWESRLGILASLGMVFAIFMTYSRAGSALAVAALCGTFWIANRRLRSRRVRMASAMMVVALVGGGLRFADSFIDRFLNAPESSEEARDEFNIAASLMAGDHLLGVGPNNFSKVLTDDARYHGHFEVMAQEGQGGVAHHIYWLTAAELGYVGLLVFSIIILRFLWLGLRWGLARKSTEGLILTGIAIGMIALHLSGFFEWALRITPVGQQYAIACGLVAGSVTRLRRRAGARVAAQRTVRSLRRTPMGVPA